jgi:hypothetical protein
MTKSLYIPATACLCVALACYTVLAAMGKDVPPWLAPIIGALFTALQAFFQSVVAKKEEPKPE